MSTTNQSCHWMIAQLRSQNYNIHTYNNIHIYNHMKWEREDLGAAFAAVGAADELDMSTAVLVAATIPSLESLHRKIAADWVSRLIEDNWDQKREREIFLVIYHLLVLWWRCCEDGYVALGLFRGWDWKWARERIYIEAVWSPTDQPVFPNGPYRVFGLQPSF